MCTYIAHWTLWKSIKGSIISEGILTLVPLLTKFCSWADNLIFPSSTVKKLFKFYAQGRHLALFLAMKLNSKYLLRFTYLYDVQGNAERANYLFYEYELHFITYFTQNCKTWDFLSTHIASEITCARVTKSVLKLSCTSYFW